ncbi:AAA+-type ATPase, SpoVK/Ycf46/Vps4 family [Mesobacillus persicus]|uniref:AAA+-type ATPase, SpoVK/Ycf46/Vps4 family n=1 Tax=Mesobacillus persicus TaxID=930146 RepID=A0A1H8ARW6_9BACI|nr:AAA family ATPase [Mesobacillus persicus]SEM73276.1 AAA+-type ATPase, SpoVK/Ycf46/Vps4 family [Mesobacillus persicus]
MRINWNIKEILKFLFPEWQVIRSIKRHGWINKEGVTAKTASRPTQPVRHNQGTKSIPRPTRSEENPAVRYQSTVPQDSREEKQPAPQGERLEGDFKWIRSELGRKMIGQKRYLDELCLAFKRPFVTGMSKNKPKNTLVLFGHPGSGRRQSIVLMAELLKQQNLVKHETVSMMDLSSYATDSEFQLFLSDLYKCLYAKTDVVLFENIDKAPSRVLDAIGQLTISGSYALPARYIMDKNKLVEATGALLQQSISEIYANGKYLVFLYEKSEQSLQDVTGSKMIGAMDDLVHMERYTDEEIKQLAERALIQLQEKARSQLLMRLEWSGGVISYIAGKFSGSTGISGLGLVVEQEIFKPLAEYKLRNPQNDPVPVHLMITDGRIMAQIHQEIIPLHQYVRDTNQTGIEQIKKELDRIIGLKQVKDYVLQLEDHVKVQKLRQSRGMKNAGIAMHMVFTGNPGTGKTTIARIVAKYLKAIGVLSTGQLREVSRADLVGEYVGQTARLTNDVIKSALGGVLFIDEAYALYRNEHDTFGVEAIDTLVKGMEDYRDDLVVILAGYSKEMETFLKANPGLKSRFPNFIHFPDYTSEEMWEITGMIAKQKGYTIAESCQKPLIQFYDKSQIKGKNDSGNGRLVRNTIEAAILNQSQRLIHEQDADMNELTYEDFKFDESTTFDLEANLAPIIGLEHVKDFVRNQYHFLIAQEKRRNAGFKVDTSQTLHMIFSGNPGTGKTTIARIVATMFKEMELLKSGHLVEVDSGGLTGQYAGHTAKKTEEVFRSALGGVLFIDEAYALATSGGSYGMEAINTLVKLMEDFREDIVVILAGYEKEMDDFLQVNTGLESRFPHRIHFPDYSPNELFEIAKIQISYKGFILAHEAESVLLAEITKKHRRTIGESGNGRMVRNFIEEVTRNQSVRIAMNDVRVEGLNVILPTDIKPTEKILKNFDLETELASIIGLDEVKEYIRSLQARLRLEQERKNFGLKVDETQTMHMIFRGNPGTGKTMMARIVAHVLYNLGVIQTNTLVETDRSDLVAGYVGQTAMKTKEVMMKAMDGVLFIDEAYALAQGGQNDFGKEAIDTLVKLMDDHRDRLVVILAGYPEDMEHFLNLNPGLRSRFPHIIDFPDYSSNELMEIAEKFYEEKGFVLTEEAKDKLMGIFQRVSSVDHFGNGRYVRNLYEKSLNNQASRLSMEKRLTEEILTAIHAEDIEEV